MKKLLLMTVVSTSLAAALPAVAQDAAPSAPEGSQLEQVARARHHGEQRAFRLPSDRAEARLAYLKTALKITDAQLPQWDAFADTMRRQARVADERIQARRAEREKRAQSGERARPTAIERLERRQAFLAAASVRLQERLAAVKPLYAVLSPEQRQVADELLAPRGRPGMRRGHRGNA